MHSISVYERIPNFGQRLDEPGTRQYARTVAQVVNDGIKWVDEITQQPKVQRELEQDLAEVVAFRDQYREQ
jgi:hypothetical protein